MLLKNPSFLNVVPGGVAACKIPLGDVVNAFHLKFSGEGFNFSAHVSRVLVRLNQTIIYDLTGAQLAIINGFRGLSMSDAFARIDFIEPMAINYGTQMLGGIDTSKGVSSLDVEVTLAAAAPVDITLNSWRDVSSADPAKKDLDPGLFLAMIPLTVPITAAGKFSLQPPHGPNKAHRVKRLHFFDPSNNLEAVGIKKGVAGAGVHIFEDVPRDVIDQINEEFGRLTKDGHLCVDWYLKGDGIENLFLGNASSLEYQLTTNGPGNIVQITEAVTSLRWL